MKNTVNGHNENDLVIEVKDVYKSFKTVDAVRGVDIKIREGEFVALLGPNGAGKTTLVEMIEGIQQPDRGDIYITGKKWKGNEDELHRIIGLSLQETRFIDKLTVEETLSLFASFYSLDKQRIVEVLKLVGLEEKSKSYTVHLSGGQRQKLALGISLLNKPKILLLDEPTTGLDPNARREIWAILQQLKKETGTSLILTTHYMDEAEKLCDYIIVIDQGRILKEGTLDELLEKDGTSLIEFTLNDTVDTDNVLQGNKNGFEINWAESRDRGLITINDPETELPRLFSFFRENNLPLKSFESRKKTLDDLFISLTGRHLNE